MNRPMNLLMDTSVAVSHSVIIWKEFFWLILVIAGACYHYQNGWQLFWELKTNIFILFSIHIFWIRYASEHYFIDCISISYFFLSIISLFPSHKNKRKWKRNSRFGVSLALRIFRKEWHQKLLILKWSCMHIRFTVKVILSLSTIGCQSLASDLTRIRGW